MAEEMNMTQLLNFTEDLLSDHVQCAPLWDKIVKWYVSQLPMIVQKMEVELFEKMSRDVVMNVFTRKYCENRDYFYCKKTMFYFVKTGDNFCEIERDTLYVNMRMEIQDSWEHLQPYEKKVITQTFAQIRENELDHVTPESNTIQSIFSILHPFVFERKEHVKYLLTFIGDIILRKEISHKIVVSPTFYSWLQIFFNHIYQWFGVKINRGQISDSVKKTFYNNVRILNVTDAFKVNVGDITSILPQSNQFLLNLAFVSIYYSQQHLNAELFLHGEPDDCRRDILSLQGKEYATIVKEFVDEYFEVTMSDQDKVTKTEMSYLWKQFIKSHGYYGIRGATLNLTDSIRHIVNCSNQEEEDFTYMKCKVNVKHVTQMEKFIKETIRMSNDPLDQYELSEIISMYKKWHADTMQMCYAVNESQLREILPTCFPWFKEETCVKNRVVRYIKCSVWRKREELCNLLTIIKNHRNDDSEFKYTTYCKIAKSDFQFTASKEYFELVKNEIESSDSTKKITHL